MANYNFNLRDSKAGKPTPLYLVIRWSGLKAPIRFYTRESIHPDLWNHKEQRAKKTRKFPEHPEFNQRLDNIMATAKDIFRQYQNDHSHEAPSPAEYKALLEAEIKGTKSGVPKNLIDFMEYFIERTHDSLKSQNSRGSVSRSYAQTLTCLKDFSRDKRKRLDFDTMDVEFYNDFMEYLETPKQIKNAKGKKVMKYGFKPNTVGKHIKNLKRVLNEAATPEMNVNKFMFYKRFKVTEIDTDTIYLSEGELTAMHRLDLRNNPGLEKTRDLFLVGAWTGLRVSDFTRIEKKNIKGDFIHIKTKKTGKDVVIPIHWTIKEILNKYKDEPNSLPQAVSNVKLNKNLKEIGKKLDILKVKEPIEVTKAGLTVKKNVEKWTLLTTHTARRSFSTNMYKKGVPTITIMAITGHETEKSFLRYIRVTPDEHAKILMGYFKEQQNLRVV